MEQSDMKPDEMHYGTEWHETKGIMKQHDKTKGIMKQRDIKPKAL
jgi:hypothetical protein